MPVNQSGIEEVQEITVKHSCIERELCFGIGYHLNYEGIMSTYIQADVSDVSDRFPDNNTYYDFCHVKYHFTGSA